jgi:hypothetical protein
VQRGSKPSERRGGRQKSTPNKTLVAKAAHVSQAGEIAKVPSFSAYIRLFELAEDYHRELIVGRQGLPVFDLSVRGDRESAFLRRTVLKVTVVDAAW